MIEVFGCGFIILVVGICFLVWEENRKQIKKWRGE